MTPITPFGFLDLVRRQAGAWMDAVGCGPRESLWRLAAEFPGARLRRYGGEGGPALLILPAPIKRPYVWDLLPEVSVVRRALEAGFAVYLLDWTEPGPAEDGFGLAEYAWRLPLAAVAAIAAETGQARVVVAANSLGGTLAAVFAALEPERVRRLVLVDSPLVFGAEGGPLAEAARRGPSGRELRRSLGSPVPGSALAMLATQAAPGVFVAQRFSDALASMGDPLCEAVRLRVERWALDEFPIAGALFEEVVDGLYREDRFRAGGLVVGGRPVRLGDVRCPVLAIAIAGGGVVPEASVLAGVEAMGGRGHGVLRYEGGRGAGLQHLAPLVAPDAHHGFWPAVLGWARAT